VTLQTVTVTWDVTDISEAGTSGSVQFALSEMLTDSATGNVISPSPPKSYQFQGVPGQSDPLVANDNATLEPSGSYYNITVAGSSAAYTYRALINHANGATQSLGSLIAQNPQPVTQFAQYLLLPSGTPSAGEVPVATGNGTVTQWGPSGTGGSGYPATPAVSGTPSAGQVLTATSATTATWETPSGGGGGGVQIGGDLGGTTASPQVTGTHLASPLPLTQGGTGQNAASGTALVSALGGLVAGNNLSDLSSASTARTNLGLGTAATQPSTAFEAAGTSLPLPAGTATAGYVPVATGSGNATTWQAQTGGGGTSGNIDGGSATSGLLPVSDIDGGNA
jgi:hypothetical protein